jgi:hypothetical protein
LKKCTGKIIDISFIVSGLKSRALIMAKDYSIGTRHGLLDERSKKKPGFHHLYKVLTYVQCIIDRHTVERWRRRNSYITRDQCMINLPAINI